MKITELAPLALLQKAEGDPQVAQNGENAGVTAQSGAGLNNPLIARQSFPRGAVPFNGRIVSPGLRQQALPREAVPSQLQAYHARQLVEALKAYHYSQPQLDDRLSAKVFDRFIERIDPSRTLLSQAELDSAGLQQFKHGFDDMLLRGDLTPAYRLFNFVNERREQFLKFALQNIDSALANPSKPQGEPTRPATTNDITESWSESLRQHAGFLLEKDEPHGARRARMADAYESQLEKRMEFTSKELSEQALDSVMDALFSAVDPHSTHMAPSELEGFLSRLSQSMEGVGVSMGMDYIQDRSGDYVSIPVIQDAVEGGPAHKAGLQAGDKMLGVQENGRNIDFRGASFDTVSAALRGSKGSVARIVIQREGEQNPRVVNVTRDTIDLPESDVQTAIINVPGENGAASSRVGVIHLPAFFRDPNNPQHTAGAAVRRALNELKAQGIDSLVLDMRGNPGGALPDALDIAGLFIPEGPVTQIKDGTGRVEVEYDPDPSVQYDGPLAVLIDRGSASASELVAAAMQDYGRGIVMGERTHGKGTVQQVMAPIPMQGTGEEFGMKMTTAKFYRINGGTTQKNGVEPDVKLSSDDNDEYGEKQLPNVLEADRIAPARFVPSGRVTDIMKAQMQASAKPSAPTTAEPGSKESLQERIDRDGDDWLKQAAELLTKSEAEQAAA